MQIEPIQEGHLRARTPASQAACLQVGFITCSMVMCGLLNMSLLKSAAGMMTEDEEAVFIFQCRKFAIQ